MTRMTLAGALGLVGFLAVGLAAARVGTGEGERLVFAVTLAVHSVGLIGTLLRKGRSPGWTGFSLLGSAFFLACTTELYTGPSGNTTLPASDLAEAAFDARVPEPPRPVVEGVRLDSEPDKLTASDLAIQAYQRYESEVSDRDSRRRRAGAIADLLASVVAAMAGAAAGRLLAPRSGPRRRRGARPRSPRPGPRARRR